MDSELVEIDRRPDYSNELRGGERRRRDYGRRRGRYDDDDGLDFDGYDYERKRSSEYRRGSRSPQWRRSLPKHSSYFSDDSRYNEDYFDQSYGRRAAGRAGGEMDRQDIQSYIDKEISRAIRQSAVRNSQSDPEKGG